MHLQNTIRGGNLSPVWLFFPCILCLVSMGCTMCPSPFDYSGTVPGSANQNNFRIRSNGVLPIWRRPKPWPPIVSKETDESPSASREAKKNVPQTSRVIVASHEEGAEDEHAQDSSVLIPQLPAPASTNDEPANSAE